MASDEGRAIDEREGVDKDEVGLDSVGRANTLALLATPFGVTGESSTVNDPLSRLVLLSQLPKWPALVDNDDEDEDVEGLRL